MPNDPPLFLRFFEDHVSCFVDLPRERQDLLFKSLNALVADAAPVTAFRRELVTVAMAVLALGKSAQWRVRALPPPAAYARGGDEHAAPASARQGGEEERPSIVGILAAFNQKELGTEDVMRGLICHDDWLAPVVALPPGPDGVVVTETVVTYGAETRLPPGELWLFTEKRYADAAQQKGALLGAYAAGLRGVDVFANVPKGLNQIRVNPGAPEAENFHLGSPDAIELGRVWANAVLLERRVAAPGALEDPEVRERLRRCQELLIILVGQSPAVLPDDRGQWLVLFTAPDYAESYRRALANARGVDGRLQPADGQKLFAAIAQMGVAGVRLNAGIEGSEVFIDAATCARIATENG
jgi:hypothetical protein